MGTSESISMKKELINEPRKDKKVNMPYSFIPYKILFKVMKAICKIRIKTEEGIAKRIGGIGFFFKFFRFKNISHNMLSYNKSSFRA